MSRFRPPLRSPRRGAARLAAAALAILFGGAVVGAQQPAAAGGVADSGAAAHRAAECPSCAGWNAPQAPFRVHGNSWYVGTRGLAALLVTSPDGHVLVDGALPESAPQILASIRALGFRPEDVRAIVNSHAHFDHAGGLAALQRASGAAVYATAPSAAMLARGASTPDDPQYGVALPFPAVTGVRLLAPGDTVRVGPLALASHRTAGHTRGGTSWSWTSCDEAGACLTIVYADSQTPVSADGFRYGGDPRYPDAAADLAAGHRTLERLRCDVLVTPHPGASQLFERVARRDAGAADALRDPDACRRYAAAARRQLDERLARERRDGGR